ncbi:hypothetical protein [Thiomicrorhabdus cannonii]|uniref:hypothetical protein n=1 Tax=Thiomicrorhabdus cannonii TaxID=2748011 RepID=UPI0015BB9872|nr:hypothetical protein [Thiomicrorhabdus cannonii]
MAIKIIDCHIENCGTGISSSSDVELDISGTKIIACKKAIELRDPPSVLDSLGLPADTPTELLKEVLETLLKTESKTPVQSAEIISKASLFEWLGGIANSSSILSNLIALQQNGLVQQVLNLLPK